MEAGLISSKIRWCRSRNVILSWLFLFFCMLGNEIDRTEIQGSNPESDRPAQPQRGIEKNADPFEKRNTVAGTFYGF